MTTKGTKLDHFHVRIIVDEAEWDSIAPAWEDLFANSPNATPALDFTWLRTWWQVFGTSYGSRTRSTRLGCYNAGGEEGVTAKDREGKRGNGGLRIITVWQGKRLQGILPLYLNQAPGFLIPTRRLMFLSTGEAEYEEICADYLGLLCRGGSDQDVARLAWQAIGNLDWEVLELLDLAADSPLLQPGIVPRHATRVARGVCPIADLTGGFNAYLERLSPNGRYQARRLLREGAEAGARLELVEAEGLDAAFADLVALHQKRWQAEGKSGVFSATRFVEFHRRLLHQWLSGGRSLLARMVLETEPVAVLYGFLEREKFDFYQSGVDTETKKRLRSPGNLAHLLLMKELAGRGVAAYDFLRGSSSYKERLATREQSLVGLRLWRCTGRAVVCRLAILARRVFRRVVSGKRVNMDRPDKYGNPSCRVPPRML